MGSSQHHHIGRKRGHGAMELTVKTGRLSFVLSLQRWPGSVKVAGWPKGATGRSCELHIDLSIRASHKPHKA